MSSNKSLHVSYKITTLVEVEKYLLSVHIGSGYALIERQERGSFIYNKYSVLLVYYVVIGWAHKMLRRYFLFMQDAIWVHLLLKKAIFMRLLFTRYSKTVAPVLYTVGQ